MNKILPALIISTGFALSGFFVGHAISKAKSFDRYVTVKGLAVKEVKANHAIWQIQFTAANNDLGALYKQMSHSESQVKAFLLKHNFKASNLSIQPMSVTDNQSNAYNSNQNVKRYTANGGIIVSTADVDKVKNAMQDTGQLVQEGIVITNTPVKYLYTELNKIKPQMLDKATANARLAAKSFANNSKSHLGAIRDASQGLFTIRDANSNYDNGTSILKRVRVVVSAQYFLG